MAGMTMKSSARVFVLLLFAQAMAGCVSTEALYAEYDEFDCVLVASKDEPNVVTLHEQRTNTHLPWEPAVYFNYDSSELNTEESARLMTSLKVLTLFPSLKLSLQGFTDSLGGSAYNRRLAERRIFAVKQHLLSKGIDESRIYLQPIGKALKQLDRDDATTHAVNRRVELMLLDETGRPMTVRYSID